MQCCIEHSPAYLDFEAFTAIESTEELFLDSGCQELINNVLETVSAFDYIII